MFMELKNMSDLAKFADLCRKKNIESIKIAADGSVEFKLRADAFKEKKPRKQKETSSEVAPLEPTEEDILFWSSTPLGEVRN